MSEYTTESPASVAARQRRRRSVLTIGVVLLGLFFAFWYGLSYYEADQEARAAKPTTPTCRPYDPEVLTPAEITVDVYNATNRSGLAGRTARLVEDRGFTLGKVANDPSDRPAPKVAEVRYGVEGRPKALVLLEYMPEGTKPIKDGRKDASLEIALGPGFTTLPPAPESSNAPMCPAPTES